MEFNHASLTPTTSNASSTLSGSDDLSFHMADFDANLHLKRRLSTSQSSFSSMCSDKLDGIQHSAVNINDVMTWMSYVLPDRKNHSDSVILFIPGNPGAIEFYDKFLQTLFDKCQIPIIGISHAGHNIIPSNALLVKRVFKELNPKMKSSQKFVYTLEQQIAHKLSFIRQYIDPSKKIILIAHSLGSYVTLQMLKRLDDPSRIKQVILLFPVFERTMETTNGKFWVPMTQILQRPAVKTTKLMEMLPLSVKKSLIDFIAHQRKFSSSSKESLASGVSSLVTPNGLRNMSQIARDLSRIGDIGELKDVINLYKKKLTFYYGANDEWTPLEFYTDMKQQFPDVDIRLDDKTIGHAFVVHSSKTVAPIVADIIKEKTMEDVFETGSTASYHDYVYRFSLKRSKSYKSGRNIVTPNRSRNVSQLTQ